MNTTNDLLHRNLVELARVCHLRQPYLRVQASRLWTLYEVLQAQLLAKARIPNPASIASDLRDALKALESCSPLPPEPGTRVLAAEFYRLLDPGCQADQLDLSTDEAHDSALVAMLTACQTMYFLFGQLLMAAEHGVSYLEGRKPELLRQQFRLE